MNHAKVKCHKGYGDKPCGSYYQTLQTEAYGKSRQDKEGLARLAEVLTMELKNDVQYFETELYRLKGELTRQQWKVESQKPKHTHHARYSVLSAVCAIGKAARN